MGERKLKPLKNWVLVAIDQPESEEMVSKAGLILPDSMTDPASNRGTVIEVGPGAKNVNTGEVRECHVKVGDRVLIGSLRGEFVESHGKACVLLPDTDLMGTLNES